MYVHIFPLYRKTFYTIRYSSGYIPVPVMFRLFFSIKEMQFCNTFTIPLPIAFKEAHANSLDPKRLCSEI